MGSRRRLWTIFGIVIASLVLGIGTTAVIYAVRPDNTTTSPAFTGPYPSGAYGAGLGQGMMGGYPGTSSSSCSVPGKPGTVVDVTLADMGGMMGRGGNGGYGPVQGQFQWPNMGIMGRPGMMHVAVNPTSVPAGEVLFRVLNSGWLTHELVVLPLADGQQPGQRTIGSDGKVDEAGSLGEASRSCGAGQGDGITAGETGWTTINLPAGRYELVCNIAGHYGAGMYAELDVTNASPSTTPPAG